MAKQLHHRTYTREVPAIINLCLDLLPLCISEQGGMTPVGGFQKTAYANTVPHRR